MRRQRASAIIAPRCRPRRAGRRAWGGGCRAGGPYNRRMRACLLPTDRAHARDACRRVTMRGPRHTLAALAISLAAVAALPIVAVFARAVAPGAGDTWSHLAQTVLPDYLANTLLLVAAGRRRCRHRRHRDRVADRAAALPRQPDLRLGAAPAARDAGLRDGLRVHRRAAVRGAGADGVARGVRLVPRRLSFPRGALGRRGGGDVRVHALPVRLPARAHRVPRAPAGAGRGGAHAGPRPSPGVLARGGAAGPAGDRRRHRARADGDACRLRHRRLLRRRHLHHRHLPGLVLAGRPGRRGAARHRAARLRRARARTGAHVPQGSAGVGQHARAYRGADGGAAADRRAGVGRDDRVRHSARGGLPDPGGCCSCGCSSPIPARSIPAASRRGRGTACASRRSPRSWQSRSPCWSPTRCASRPPPRRAAPASC